MTTYVETEGRVVVSVHPRLYQHKTLGTWAARIPELGLTAYGDSQEHASAKLRRMFAAAVKARRARSLLSDWLSRSGLEWYWAVDYSGAVPVVDADQETSGGESAGWLDATALQLAA
jgi:hypothetical protein